MNRHIKLGIKLLRETNFDRNLGKYVLNHINWSLHNPNKSLIVPFPTNLMLELGNRCNLHCVICPREYQYGKAMDQGFMPLENVYAIIDELYPYLDSIGLTGLGETLLYPQLMEVLQYIKSKRKNIIITISTNANFMGCVEKIKPLLPYIDNVQFSVDGIGDVYEKIRPNTHFDDIANNIRQIISLGKSSSIFMLNMVITRENYQDVSKVVSFAKSIGIEYINFNRINLASISEIDHEDYHQFFHSHEYLDTISILKALKQSFPGITLPDASDTKGEFKNCNFMWKHQYITWNGFVVPCCAKPFPKEMNFGNVFDDGVMSVLNGKKMQAWRKLWQQNITPAFCNNCNTIYM